MSLVALLALPQQEEPRREPEESDQRNAANRAAHDGADVGVLAPARAGCGAGRCAGARRRAAAAAACFGRTPPGQEEGPGAGRAGDGGFVERDGGGDEVAAEGLAVVCEGGAGDRR
jgi:hypothetical protein